MKITYLVVTIMTLAFVSTTYAEWSRQCLDDCFSTGHDCHFCAYQCTTEPLPSPPYVSPLPCPLEGNWQSGD